MAVCIFWHHDVLYLLFDAITYIFMHWLTKSLKWNIFKIISPKWNIFKTISPIQHSPKQYSSQEVKQYIFLTSPIQVHFDINVLFMASNSCQNSILICDMSFWYSTFIAPFHFILTWDMLLSPAGAVGPGTGDIATPPVCLSVRPSVCPSVRLSVRLSVRHV